MRPDFPFIDAMRQTRILRPPKHAMATFGTSAIRYVLLSAASDQPDYCRVREGEVTAQRPKILTPEFWKNRFEGFGSDADTYREELEKAYGDTLKGLEYQFRNDLKTTSLEHATLLEVTDRARTAMDAEDAPRTALLEGPDGNWPLAVMKFIVDMTLRSFPINMQELDDRGLFNPAARQDARERLDIEKLFTLAQTDRTHIPLLAERLKRTGRWMDYEDRFFALVGR